MRRQLAGLSAAAMLWAGWVIAQDGDLFNKLDVNKDGFVTSDEVPDAQKSLFERLLRNADKDGDKKLNKDEFQAGLKPDEAPKPPLAGGQGPGGPRGGKGDPREFFGRLDANKDGKLSKDELPERMRENFARLDANSDGSISPEELGRARPPGAPPQGARPMPGQGPGREELAALFDRTDSNSDGKLTKEEIPEERTGMRAILERSGGTSIDKEQFVRGMLAMAAQFGQPPRPEGAPPRPDGAMPRPDGPPGGLPPGMRLFGAIDADRNGELSTAEIVAAGTSLLKLDRNGDGKVTIDEALGGVGGGPPPGRPADGQPPPGAPGERRPGQRGLGGLNPEEFRARLKEADANKDGKISKDEAPPLIKDRFDRIDTNSDGFIDDSEVKQMLDRMRDAGGKGPPGRKGGDQPRRPDADNK